MTGRLAALAGAMLIVAAPGQARADWLRAETEHFLVYSNGSERSLRDYAARLERFDALMRRVSTLPPSEGLRKLPVYLVANARELREVQSDLPTGIAGFYQAGSSDIRAVLVRGREDDVLLHEYGHHFMSHNLPGGYPGWFREGFAEYFATATVEGRGRATVGYPNMGRLADLQQMSWIPLDELLRLRPQELERRGQRAAFYAQSWLLTHYILADSDRLSRLQPYLEDVARGEDPVEALNTRFGLTPQTLTRNLRAYVAGSMRYAELVVPVLDPSMTVTRLPESADDLMLIGLDVQDGAPDDVGPGLLERVRTLAVRHPSDPFALTVLARAEIEWGDAAAGDTALQQVLVAEPENVEALLMLARRRFEAGDEAADREGMLALYGEGRRYLATAYRVDPSDYRVLTELARSRRRASDYPTENDLATWREAVRQAPQVLGLRGEAADAMLLAGLDDEAEHYLLPIAMDPHAGGFAERARARIDSIRARRGDQAEQGLISQPS